MSLYAIYLSTVFLIIVTPGPSALLMVQHAASFGIKRCVFNALGSILASSILIIISLAGVSLLLSDTLINTLSLFGALLLIWVGISSIKPISMETCKEGKSSGARIFRQSFTTGISNPKDIIFFVTLLPQFIDQTLPYAHSSMILLWGWVILDFSIMMGYAAIACLLIKRLNSRYINITRAASGSLITTIGVTLLYGSVTQLI